MYIFAVPGFKLAVTVPPVHMPSISDNEQQLSKSNHLHRKKKHLFFVLDELMGHLFCDTLNVHRSLFQIGRSLRYLICCA